MKIYELTYIISPQINPEELNDISKNIESFIQNKEGVVLKSEKPRAQTLAYPIKKQSSGYFSTLEFQISEDKVKEIKDNLEKNGKTLRHIIVVKGPQKELKERRIRKPMFMQSKITKKPSFVDSSKAGGESVKMEDIEKKLDEILNE